MIYKVLRSQYNKPNENKMYLSVSQKNKLGRNTKGVVV